MPNDRARIILYIDPETFEMEAEAPLDREMLKKIAEDVNNDAGFIYGYEAWDYAMPGEPFSTAKEAKN